MKKECYEVSNITVKPPRKDASGKDLRTTVEKVGHPVQFRDENDKVIILMPGRSRIVSEIDDGLMGLQRGGFIRIKKIENITTALAEHSFQKAQEKAEKQQFAAKTKAAETRASAVEMGQDPHTQKSGAEYEGAVNPDGDPNFLVKAPRGGKRGPKKNEVANDAGVPDAT